ncbi:MAG: hypothetical protein ACC656_01370 [Candidatus Heimdallarchaeota archaeon]
MKADVPLRKSFPFDLPDVDWILKLYQGREFFQTLPNSLLPYWNSPYLEITVQDLLILLDQVLDLEILTVIKTLKTNYGEFIHLRQILAEHEVSSKQIKRRIKRFERHLRKRLDQYPEYQKIIDRLHTYSKKLYHGYDDPRIPLDNLEIERMFNNTKRDFRKQTGLKTRTNFILLDGETLFAIDHYKAQFLPNSTVEDFIDKILPKRLLFDTPELIQLFNQFSERKKQNKQFLAQKYTNKQASQKFHKLKTNLARLSRDAN